MNILLLDAYNLLFRSFASLPATIADASGEPINAVYGTLASIIRLHREFAPAPMVAAFDSPPTPTFRHELYPAYQAQRGPMGGDRAAEFARQVEIAKERLPSIGVPTLSVAGYEADDIMGTLACQAAEAGLTALLVSSDRDLLQLIRPGVEVLSPRAWQRIRDEAEVRAILGVPPAGVTTFKALAGDPSDNIPGITGIGAKTAADLVNRYGSLEALYAHLEELPARTARALTAGRDDAFLFRQIVTISTDVKLPVRTSQLPVPSIGPDDGPRALLEQMAASGLAGESGTPGGIRTPDL